MIKVTTASLNALRESDLPLAVFAFEDGGIAGAASLTPKVRKAVLDKAKSEHFKGTVSDCVTVFASDGARERRFIVVGLGKRKGFSPEALRRAAGALSQFARKRYAVVAVLPNGEAQALAEGLLLASYRFEEYKKPEEGVVFAEARLVIEAAAQRAKLEAAVNRAALYAEAVCLTRDLVNRGPSDKRPESLGAVAKALAEGHVTVKLIDAKEAEKLGMGSYLSVARGSDVPPCFVHLVYKPKGAKRKIGLVGKGITFDSGGLSLKPPQSMEDMKMDMAGAALVLGVFKVIERLKIKAEVH
ncbi:MAG: leucyl aminopeptidase, partial [Elusimicrobia bacterium]